MSFFFTVVLCISVSAQDSSAFKRSTNTHRCAFFSGNENDLHYDYNKKAIKVVAITNVVGYSTAMIGLYAAWYKNYPQSNFHFFDDNAEWQQMDKIGHTYSAYAEGRASMELWRLTGISRKKRIIYGGLSGLLYQTTIEVLDGFSSEWGFSRGDMTANVVGASLFTAQEFAWNEQRIQFKWSFHRKYYADQTLNDRSDEIFGKSDPERYLKDYNGQTYWLSTNLSDFLPNRGLPRWLQVSVGTGAEGMFGARSNIGTKNDSPIPFSRPDIPRYRQWYLSPDLDVTKIKTNKKAVRMLLNIFSIVKIPAPALEYSRKGFRFHAVCF